MISLLSNKHIQHMNTIRGESAEFFSSFKVVVNIYIYIYIYKSM
jgi:hypothetical protein